MSFDEARSPRTPRAPIKTPGSRKAAVWKCTSCTMQNAVSLLECQLCGSPQPAGIKSAPSTPQPDDRDEPQRRASKSAPVSPRISPSESPTESLPEASLSSSGTSSSTHLTPPGGPSSAASDVSTASTASSHASHSSLLPPELSLAHFGLPPPSSAFPAFPASSVSSTPPSMTVIVESASEAVGAPTLVTSRAAGADAPDASVATSSSRPASPMPSAEGGAAERVPMSPEKFAKVQQRKKNRHFDTQDLTVDPRIFDLTNEAAPAAEVSAAVQTPLSPQEREQEVADHARTLVERLQAEAKVKLVKRAARHAAREAAMQEAEHELQRMEEQLVPDPQRPKVFTKLSWDAFTTVQNITLFEARTRYYLVGTDVLAGCYRLLEIDRSAYPNLRLWEHELPYTYEQIQKKIYDLTRVHINTGGLVRKAHLQGIIGFVRLPRLYMLAITQGDHVTSIANPYLFDAPRVVEEFSDMFKKRKQHSEDSGDESSGPASTGDDAASGGGPDEDKDPFTRGIFTVKQTQLFAVHHDTFYPPLVRNKHLKTMMGLSDKISHSLFGGFSYDDGRASSTAYGGMGDELTDEERALIDKYDRILAADEKYKRVFESLRFGDAGYYYSHDYDLTSTAQFNTLRHKVDSDDRLNASLHRRNTVAPGGERPSVTGSGGASGGEAEEASSSSAPTATATTTDGKPDGDDAAADADGDDGAEAFVYNEQFLWNAFLCQEFLAVAPKLGYWLVPLIHGYVCTKDLGGGLSLTLLARRSRHHAGRRFLRRGLNDEGHVANEVETEQILYQKETVQRPEGLSAAVVLRGSAPLFWGQPVPPEIVVDLARDLQLRTVGLHFDMLFERYGTPLVLLNLTMQTPEPTNEATLGRAYAAAMSRLNDTLKRRFRTIRGPRKPRIDFAAYDFHANRRANQSVIQDISNMMSPAVQELGVFSYGHGVAEEDGSSGYKRQRGVVRVNCVDTLDRTNVGQACVMKAAMRNQLLLGLDILEFAQIFPKALEALNELWTEHGDYLALQYAGSASMHSDALNEDVQSAKTITDTPTQLTLKPSDTPHGFELSDEDFNRYTSRNSSSSSAGGFFAGFFKSNVPPPTMALSPSNAQQPQRKPTLLNRIKSGIKGVKGPRSRDEWLDPESGGASRASAASIHPTDDVPGAAGTRASLAGRRTTGMAKDVASAVTRYYHNTFTDAETQAAMDVLLGQLLPPPPDKEEEEAEGGSSEEDSDDDDDDDDEDSDGSEGSEHSRGSRSGSGSDDDGSDSDARRRRRRKRRKHKKKKAAEKEKKEKEDKEKADKEGKPAAATGAPPATGAAAAATATTTATAATATGKEAKGKDKDKKRAKSHRVGLQDEDEEEDDDEEEDGKKRTGKANGLKGPGANRFDNFDQFYENQNSSNVEFYRANPANDPPYLPLSPDRPFDQRNDPDDPEARAMAEAEVKARKDEEASRLKEERERDQPTVISILKRPKADPHASAEELKAREEEERKRAEEERERREKEEEEEEERLWEHDRHMTDEEKRARNTRPIKVLRKKNPNILFTVAHTANKNLVCYEVIPPPKSRYARAPASPLDTYWLVLDPRQIAMKKSKGEYKLVEELGVFDKNFVWGYTAKLSETAEIQRRFITAFLHSSSLKSLFERPSRHSKASTQHIKSAKKRAKAALDRLSHYRELKFHFELLILPGYVVSLAVQDLDGEVKPTALMRLRCGVVEVVQVYVSCEERTMRKPNVDYVEIVARHVGSGELVVERIFASDPVDVDPHHKPAVIRRIKSKRKTKGLSALTRERDDSGSTHYLDRERAAKAKAAGGTARRAPGVEEPNAEEVIQGLEIF